MSKDRRDREGEVCVEKREEGEDSDEDNFLFELPVCVSGRGIDGTCLPIGLESVNSEFEQEVPVSTSGYRSPFWTIANILNRTHHAQKRKQHKPMRFLSNIG